MDIKTAGPAPTAAEAAAVDELLGPPEASSDSGRVVRGGQAARSRRHLLLPALHALSVVAKRYVPPNRPISLPVTTRSPRM